MYNETQNSTNIAGIVCVDFILHNINLSFLVQSLATHRLGTTDLDGKLKKANFGIVSHKSTDNTTGHLFITNVEFHHIVNKCIS
jgi:hypothetical protein